MSKIKVLNVIKWIAKYLMPALIGWLEGDTHAIFDFVQGLLTLI